MKGIPAILFFCGSAVAASTAQATCLDEATTFAINLCGNIERSGLKETASGSAQANASLNSVIKKFVDASGSAGGQASIEK